MHDYSTRQNPKQDQAPAPVTPSAPSSSSDQKLVFSQEEIDELVSKAVENAIRSSTALFNTKLSELREKCAAQENKIDRLEERMKKMELAYNNIEQYSRRSHLRIKGLKVGRNSDCKTEVVAFINNRLKLKDHTGALFHVSRQDIDAAHPLPSRQPSEESALQPLPTIIVRFHARDVRDAVLKSRRQLKGTNITITEDLTSKNAKLVAELKKRPGVEASWSWGGKIYAKHHDSSHPKRYDIFDL